MGCLGCEDEPKDDEIEGPNKPDERGCTDIACLCLLVVYWIGMLAVMGIAVTLGNPYSVIYGKDYGGFRCGLGGKGVPDSTLTKAYYPRLSQDLAAQPGLLDTPWKLKLYGLCLEDCPKQGDVIADYGCDDPELYPFASPEACGKRAGNWIVPLDTISIGNRCLPVKKRLANETVLCASPDCLSAGRDCYTEQFSDKLFWKMDPRSQADVAQCVTQVRLGTSLQYEASGAGPAEEKLAAGMQGMNQLVMAVMESKLPIFIFGVLMPVVLGFLFIFLMRWMAKPLVYLAILLLMLVMLAATVLCAIKAGVFGDAANAALESKHASNSSIASAYAQIQSSETLASAHSYASAASSMTGVGAGYEFAATTAASNERVFELALLVLVILDVALVVYLCVFQTQIEIAIEIVEEGSHVISHQPMQLAFPFATICWMCVLIVYFMVGAVFIGTLNNDKLEGALANMTDDYSNYTSAYNMSYGGEGGPEVSQLKWWLGAFHLFGFLWSANFVLATTTCTLAGAVCYWFFYRDNDEEYPRTTGPVLASLWMVVRYHLGSMAFGSLIIAIVQFIRIVLEYIDNKTKDMQEQSMLLRFAMKCVKCCMWCFEKCIKFVSNYAYIYIALNGDSFCSACRATFMLFLNYPAQVSMNAFVQTLLRVLQCVALPLSCAVACYYYAQEIDMSVNPVLPSVFALVLAYIVARVFSGVYETTIDTIFVCTMRDKDKYEGRHTPDDLARVLGINRPDDSE